MYKLVEFSRDVLFDKVWETPLLRLAQEIGVSDVALAKACRRASIPLPGRGYWAKDASSRGGKPALPELSEPYYEVVSFRVLDPERVRPTVVSAPPGEPIAVPDKLDAPHPLVARTLREGRKAKTDNGRLVLDRRRVLDVRISPESLDRTACLLDALIRASEAKGYAWKVTPDGATTVLAEGEKMKVLVKERVSRREIPPPPAPKRRAGHRRIVDFEARSYPRYEWVATGELSFHIDESYSSEIRKSWNDTPRTRLESKLHEILAGFAPAAAAIQARREEHEAWQRKRAEEERQRIAKARQAEEQRRLRRRLVQATDRWERAVRIRAFCAAAGSQLAAFPPEQQAAATAWLAWANEQADMLDPFRGDLEQLFSLHAHVEEWFTGAYYHQDNAWDWWA